MHPDPENEPVELQTAIGRLVMAWAYAEAAIDGICATLFGLYDPQRTIEPELPRAFRRKIEYIKKCFKRLDVLKPLEVPFIPAIHEIIKLSDTRHFIAHGFILDHEFVFNGQEFIQRKMDYGAEKHALGSKLFTISEIYDVSGRCLEMSGILANFGRGLIALRQTIGDVSDKLT